MSATIPSQGKYHKDMKLILLSSLFILAFILVIPQAFATPLKPGSNTLENTELHGESAVITLDIEFGQDEYQPLRTRTIVHPQIESINLEFYGDKITLSEPELRIVNDGRLFRIVSVPEGILIYGHQNKELENYKINVLIATDKGLSKFPLSTFTPLPVYKVVETEEPEEEVKAAYVPELIITSSHDPRTYWKDDFNIDVQTFDANINPDPKSSSDFEGRIDGVDVTVIISFGEELITTLKGITEYGEWKGFHYIRENLVQSGEYTIDVIATLNNQSISQTSSMFIIATVAGGTGVTSHAPIAIAGNDQTEPENVLGVPTVITLDASGSSDPSDHPITYRWIETTSTGVSLNSTTSKTVEFTAPDVSANEDITFELTVTDDGGKFSSDTVTIIITFVD